MRNKMIFRLERNGFTRSFGLHMATLNSETGRFSGARRMEFVELQDGEFLGEAAVTIQADEIQALMDELWSAGFRPSEGTGSAGAMAAVQAHLADMRELVFRAKTRKP